MWNVVCDGSELKWQSRPLTDGTALPVQGQRDKESLNIAQSTPPSPGDCDWLQLTRTQKEKWHSHCGMWELLMCHSVTLNAIQLSLHTSRAALLLTLCYWTNGPVFSPPDTPLFRLSLPIPIICCIIVFWIIFMEAFDNVCVCVFQRKTSTTEILECLEKVSKVIDVLITRWHCAVVASDGDDLNQMI